MAHNRDIPIAYSYLAEKRVWELMAASKGEVPEPAKDSHLRVFAPTLLTSPNFPVLLERESGMLSGLTSVLVEFFSAELISHLRATLNDLRESGDLQHTTTPMLVTWPSETLAIREANPWVMREEFFRLRETDEALLGFLNRWGLWDHTTFAGIGGKPWQKLGEPQAMAVVPLLVWQRRSELRNAMLGKADEWLAERASLGFTHRRKRYPYVGITDRFISKAIENTITLDHLRKVKWRTCKRPDCDNIFAVESEHGKLYCQQYCAHIVSVRRKRAAIKRTAKTASRKGV